MATAKKVANPQSLIGKQITGFKFPEREDLFFHPYMERHLGQVGTIVDYFPHIKAYRVNFGSDYWSYPVEHIQKHLVMDTKKSSGSTKASKETEKGTSIIGYKLKDEAMNYAIQQITGYEFDFYNLKDAQGNFYHPIVPATDVYSGTDCYQILKKNGMLAKFFEPVTEFTFQYKGYDGKISEDGKTVTIGCQTLTVEFVKELHRLSNGGYLTLETQTQKILKDLVRYLE